MLIFIIVYLGMGWTSAMLGDLPGEIETHKHRQRDTTNHTLATAAHALEVHALTRSGNVLAIAAGKAPSVKPRLLMLPCPDNVGDKDLDGSQDPTCAAQIDGNNHTNHILKSGSRFGRLPWRSQRINAVDKSINDGIDQDLRDSHGNRLWYAVSRNLVAPSTEVYTMLNFHSLAAQKDGWLQVTDKAGITVNNKVAAVVLAPNRISGRASVNETRLQTLTLNYDVDVKDENGRLYPPKFFQTYTSASATVRNSDYDGKFVYDINAKFGDDQIHYTSLDDWQDEAKFFYRSYQQYIGFNNIHNQPTANSLLEETQTLIKNYADFFGFFPPTATTLTVNNEYARHCEVPTLTTAMTITLPTHLTLYPANDITVSFAATLTTTTAINTAAVTTNAAFLLPHPTTVTTTSSTTLTLAPYARITLPAHTPLQTDPAATITVAFPIATSTTVQLLSSSIIRFPTATVAITNQVTLQTTATITLYSVITLSAAAPISIAFLNNNAVFNLQQNITAHHLNDASDTLALSYGAPITLPAHTTSLLITPAITTLTATYPIPAATSVSLQPTVTIVLSADTLQQPNGHLFGWLPTTTTISIATFDDNDTPTLQAATHSGFLEEATLTVTTTTATITTTTPSDHWQLPRGEAIRFEQSVYTDIDPQSGILYSNGNTLTLAGALPASIAITAIPATITTAAARLATVAHITTTTSSTITTTFFVQQTITLTPPTIVTVTTSRALPTPMTYKDRQRVVVLLSDLAHSSVTIHAPAVLYPWRAAKEKEDRDNIEPYPPCLPRRNFFDRQFRLFLEDQPMALAVSESCHYGSTREDCQRASKGLTLNIPPQATLAIAEPITLTEHHNFTTTIQIVNQNAISTATVTVQNGMPTLLTSSSLTLPPQTRITANMTRTITTTTTTMTTTMSAIFHLQETLTLSINTTIAFPEATHLIGAHNTKLDGIRALVMYSPKPLLRTNCGEGNRTPISINITQTDGTTTTTVYYRQTERNNVPNTNEPIPTLSDWCYWFDHSENVDDKGDGSGDGTYELPAPSRDRHRTHQSNDYMLIYGGRLPTP